MRIEDSSISLTDKHISLNIHYQRLANNVHISLVTEVAAAAILNFHLQTTEFNRTIPKSPEMVARKKSIRL